MSLRHSSEGADREKSEATREERASLSLPRDFDRLAAKVIAQQVTPVILDPLISTVAWHLTIVD